VEAIVQIALAACYQAYYRTCNLIETTMIFGLEGTTVLCLIVLSAEAICDGGAGFSRQASVVKTSVLMHGAFVESHGRRECMRNVEHQYAHESRPSPLSKACTSFIISEGKAALASDGFKDLLKESIISNISSKDVCATEEEAFKEVMAWGQAEVARPGGSGILFQNPKATVQLQLYMRARARVCVCVRVCEIHVNRRVIFRYLPTTLPAAATATCVAACPRTRPPTTPSNF
jgi:hypothetical protein